MRLLAPTDFGLMAMASVFTGMAQMLVDFGIGSTVIALQTLRPDEEEQLHAMSILLGCLALLATVVCAYPMSVFFRESELTAVTAALGLPLLAQGAGAVPLARLAKALDYRSMATAELLRSLSGAATSLGLALSGAGVWTLVGSQVVSAFAATCFVLLRTQTPIRRPRLAKLRRALEYGRDTMLSRVGWMAYTESSKLIGGRMLGARVLGEFNFAWSLSSMPGEKLTLVLNGVAAPILARAQTNPQLLRRLLSRLIEGTAFVTWPLLAGLAVLAPLVVEVVFGSKWSNAVPSLIILCLYWMTATVSSPFSHLFLASGAAHVNRQLSLLAVLVMPGAFWLGARIAGPYGLACAWLVTVPVAILPSLIVLNRRIGFGAREFFHAIWPAGFATSVMTISIFSTLWTVSGTNGMRLAAAISVGGVSFLVTAWLMRGRELSQLLHAIRHPVQMGSREDEATYQE
jgi:teichuronic acid exporter